MSNPVPTVGRIVQYTLSEDDAKRINKRRDDAVAWAHEHKLNPEATGKQVHVGNQALAGQVYPMVIVRVWGETPESAVNGQVLLDGNDAMWVTSVTVGEGPRRFTWPVSVPKGDLYVTQNISVPDGLDPLALAVRIAEQLRGVKLTRRPADHIIDAANARVAGQ